MPALIDLTGKKFNRLTVLGQHGHKWASKVAWLCRCDCGTEKVFAGYQFKGRRAVKSCGCQKREVTIARNRKHGLSGHPLTFVWYCMLDRCRRSRAKAFKNYGGRGIHVCDEWQAFQPFYDWAVSNGYQPGLTIERVDNDGPYSPNNCTWIPRAQQSKNRRNTRSIRRSDGTSFATLAAAAESVGGSRSALRAACSRKRPYRDFAWSFT
jgi:hypothetical protein